MSKSRAKKLREKIVREGGFDPANKQSFFTKNRDGFQFISEKKGKTKKDALYKQKYKQSYN
ncbi:hypothetical protein AAGG74_18235 [Bacillus mexicanus]|uniref:hypothetical protein n=1 Tax=Bacillus mexicanus TaxID=2834415 RepID=UPI003D25B639